MQEAYRVVVVAPPGYTHFQVFAEVAVLLKSSLVSAGRDCDVAFNDLAADRTNIFLGSHLLQHGEYLGRYRYIPYQLEQLSASEGVYSDNLHKVLAGAVQVWDYSKENIEFLGSRGIAARHLPLGYHSALERIAHASTKDVDILFYGSVGERRKKILHELGALKGVTTKAGFGAYGEERDKYIGRAKIVLNMHYYTTRIFEAVRISYLLNNRCFVVSEDSDVNPYPEVSICCAPYEKIVDACKNYLSKPDEIEAERNRTYEEFKREYPMTQLIEHVLR